MSEYGSEIVLIEPAPPLLQLECENCVNGPLVANFGSSSPYENITCKLLVDNQFDDVMRNYEDGCFWRACKVARQQKIVNFS